MEVDLELGLDKNRLEKEKGTSPGLSTRIEREKRTQGKYPVQS